MNTASRDDLGDYMDGLEIRFEGRREVSAPLTWPQRRTWRGSLLKYRLVHLQPLPGPTPLRDVCETLRWAYEEFEVLRTVFPVDSDGEPFQLVTRSGAAEVRVIEATTSSLEEELLSAERRFQTERHDVTTDLAVIFALVMCDDSVTHIFILGSHVALDFHGFAALQRAMMKRLATEVDGLAPAAMQPVDRARFEQSAVARKRSDRALAYWRKVIESLPVDNFSEGAGIMDSAALRTAVTILSDRYKVGTAAVYMAVVAIVMGSLTDRSSCSFLIPVSNRAADDLHEFVGELVQNGAGVVDSLDGTFDDVVASVRRMTMLAYRYSHYDEQDLQRILIDIDEGTDHKRAFDVAFNDMRVSTTDDVAPADAAGLPELMGGTTVWSGDYFYQGASRFLSIALKCAPADIISVTVNGFHFQGVSARQILLAIEALAVRAAAETPEVLRAPLRFSRDEIGGGRPQSDRGV
jgi:hypothetical protein